MVNFLSANAVPIFNWLPYQAFTHYSAIRVVYCCTLYVQPCPIFYHLTVIDDT